MTQIDLSNIGAFVKDYIFPFLILALSYFGTIKAEEIRSNKVRESQKSDFIEKLNIEVNKLFAIFTQFKTDVQEKKYFSISTIVSGRPIIAKLKTLSQEVTMITDPTLRNNIINNLDLAISLYEEIDSMENYVASKTRELEEIRYETLKELRSLGLDILQIGFGLNENSDLIQLGPTKNPQEDNNKRTAINKLIEVLMTRHNESKNSVDNLYKEIEGKRTFWTIRILDSETKLRELMQKLA